MQICTTVAWVFPQDVTSSELIKTFLRTIFSKQSVRKSLFWVTHALPAERKIYWKVWKSKIFLRKDAKTSIYIWLNKESDQVDLLFSEGKSGLHWKYISFEYNLNRDTKSPTLSACMFLALTPFIYLKTSHQIMHQPLCNISSRLSLIFLGNFRRNTFQYGLLYDPLTSTSQFHFRFPLLLNYFLN